MIGRHPQEIGGDLPTRAEHRVEYSEGFAAFLTQQSIALACTSYQTGRLYLVGPGHETGVSLHHAMYPQATGLVVQGNSLCIATSTQIVRLENVLAPGTLHHGAIDRVFVPRLAHVTGNVETHQIGLLEDGAPLFVNTMFSCLCVPGEVQSFRPIWKPRFISALEPQDRCHLNGVAMEHGRPRYVSAFHASDTSYGWREHVVGGGLVVDVETGETVVTGLSMPHSPRLYNDQLWVANSGTGELGIVEMRSGQFRPVCFFPGYVRGVEFVNDYAIVTVSKFRPDRLGNVQLLTRLKGDEQNGWCGIQVVSLKSGAIEAWLRFDGVVRELFDIALIAHSKAPYAVGTQPRDLQRFLSYDRPSW